MIILEKLKGSALKALKTILLFFTEIKPVKRQSFSNMDMIEIGLALLPAAIFGCLLFGLNALVRILLCVAVCILFALLWDIIFKRENIAIDYKSALTGLILALILSSSLHFAYIIAISIVTMLLSKLLFRNNELALAYPVLIANTLFLIVFFKVFTAYVLPFENTVAASLPLNYMFGGDSAVFSAKDLFFGLQSGNIGEISDFLLLVGAIYLMLRKIINPVICSFCVATVAILSHVFGQSLPLSLLGGGLFFAAFILTMDYGFLATPLYKKILYGICCGVLTCFIRLIFKSEGAALAVLLSNLIFKYVTCHNIKRVFEFCKNIDFKKYYEKILGKLKKSEH